MNVWVISVVVLVVTSVLAGVMLELFHSGFWRVGKRLKMINRDGNFPGAPNAESNERFPQFSSLLERQGSYTIFERQLERTGLKLRPGECLAAWAVVIIALAALGWLLWGLLGVAVGVLLAVAAGIVTIKALQQRRMNQFEKQLADALMLIASSLRSGYGLLRSFQAIRDEMRPPISVEFGKVLDETAVGLSVAEALTRLLERIPLPDLDIAVTAILIQLEVGGNLAEVIEIVAATVRERQRIRGEVDTLTAEGKLSGIVLFILPIVMAFVLMFLNPSYISTLTKTSVGHLLIACAAAMEAIGGLVMNRMLKIDF